MKRWPMERQRASGNLRKRGLPEKSIISLFLALLKTAYKLTNLYNWHCRSLMWVVRRIRYKLYSTVKLGMNYTHYVMTFCKLTFGCIWPFILEEPDDWPVDHDNSTQQPWGILRSWPLQFTEWQQGQIGLMPFIHSCHSSVQYTCIHSPPTAAAPASTRECNKFLQLLFLGFMNSLASA